MSNAANSSLHVEAARRTTERVAKIRVADIVRLPATDTATSGNTSSIVAQLNENLERVDEMEMPTRQLFEIWDRARINPSHKETIMEARKIACLGAAAFVGSMLVGTVASPVHAQAHHPLTVTGHPDEMTRVVPYGDLSLATSEGRKILMRRVGYAVDEICTPSEVNGGSLDVPYCIARLGPVLDRRSRLPLLVRFRSTARNQHPSHFGRRPIVARGGFQPSRLGSGSHAADPR